MPFATSRFDCGLVAALAFVAAWTSSPDAAAVECDPRNQLSTCINADILWPHAGAGPFFSIGSVATTPAEKVSFALVLSYLSRPIGLRIRSPDSEGTIVY